MSNMNLNDATARHISTGAQDNSKGSLPVEPTRLCQHIPLWYVWAPRGTTGRFYGTAKEQVAMFGTEAFDEKGKYTNHHVKLRNFLFAQGAPNNAAAVIQRLIPKDNKVKANVEVWLDVLPTKVPKYARNSTGEIYTAQQGGQKEIKGYIDGFKIKWYKKSSTTQEGMMGELKHADGSMAKWKMDLTPESTEVHVTAAQSNDIENTLTGHTNWADKTVYVYADDATMYEPKWQTSTRKKFTVDNSGTATLGGEETFGTTPGVEEKSKIIPIFEVRAAEVGSWYNLVGFSFESLTGLSAPSDIIEKTKNLAYNLYLYTKDSPLSSPRLSSNVYGDNYSQFTFQKDSINPLTGNDNSFEYVVRNSLFNTTDPNKALIYPFLEGIYLYRDNLTQFLQAVNLTEIPNWNTEPEMMKDNIEVATATWYDYTGNNAEELKEEYGLINPFTCRTTNKVPYFSLSYDVNAPASKLADYTEVVLVNNTPIFLANGSDGTMTPEAFEELVREDLANYANPEHMYMDLGLNIENFLYDTGFEIKTKEEMSKFQMIRKDTNVVGCTYYTTLGDKLLSPEEEDGISNALVANARLYEESETFGTPTIRHSVFIGTAAMPDKPARIPLTYEIAMKIANLMGGPDGRWIPSAMFDSDPKNRLQYLLDPFPKFISPSRKQALTKSGVNYVQAGGYNEFFFPALRTVYPDKTSIANSLINSLAIGTCERMAYIVWTKLTGDMKRTPAQFAEYGRGLAAELVNDIFGGVLQVTVDFTITEGDKERGFSWHLTYNIYGNVMKSVQAYTTKLYRNEFLVSND